ncbi:MAG TPA: alpha/beta family hydrolase [Streptosporangiaceae bacterium]
MRSVEIATGGGAALAELDGNVRGARFLLALTHGAGGGIGSPDLLAVRDAALDLGALVARVVQPYRLRGARAPGSAVRQDEAWAEIISALREVTPRVPVVQGGRSNGARVACRTAAGVGAIGVVALAFPLHPPGSRGKSRADELLQARDAGIPVLVVNGERDPFGVPDKRYADRLAVIPGETHALRGHASVIRSAVTQWFSQAQWLSTALGQAAEI